MLNGKYHLLSRQTIFLDVLMVVLRVELLTI
nr:MAG TPA: hypothetical protein [Caudoviricetes sp.]